MLKTVMEVLHENRLRRSARLYLPELPLLPMKIVESLCKKVGLFIVPVGEMEGFDKTINKEKKDWVYHVLLTYDLAAEPKLTEARTFVQAVVDFKSPKTFGQIAISNWTDYKE